MQSHANTYIDIIREVMKEISIKSNMFPLEKGLEHWKHQRKHDDMLRMTRIE